MCSYQEWERFSGRFRESIDEDQVREFVASALDHLETLIEEFKAEPCRPQRPDWASASGRRSRTEWVA